MKHVYTLDDLVSREMLDAGAPTPAKLAVIGHPVAHSASPAMHGAALEEAGIAARYIRLEVEPGRVAEAFSRMRALGFIGCNVTVPHKLEAMENCEVDPAARELGAVNTIRFEEHVTRGFNTDGPGFQKAVEEAFKISFSSLNVVIAGAGGGAGQAIAAQACQAGVKRLVLINRTAEKLKPLIDRLTGIGSETEIVALAFDSKSLEEMCLSCDLIVNTSSVGLKQGDASILPASCIREGHLVYDTIYQPPVTPLLATALQKNAATANGLSMLIHQGALAFQHWFAESNPLPAMKLAMAPHSAS